MRDRGPQSAVFRPVHIVRQSPILYYGTGEKCLICSYIKATGQQKNYQHLHYIYLTSILKHFKICKCNISRQKRGNKNILPNRATLPNVSFNFFLVEEWGGGGRRLACAGGSYSVNFQNNIIILCILICLLLTLSPK